MVNLFVEYRVLQLKYLHIDYYFLKVNIKTILLKQGLSESNYKDEAIDI